MWGWEHSLVRHCVKLRITFTDATVFLPEVRAIIHHTCHVSATCAPLFMYVTFFYFFFQIRNWFSFPLPIRKYELSRSMPEAHSVSVALAASFKWRMMREGSHVNISLQSNSEMSKPHVNVSQVIKITSLQKISVWHWELFLALLSCWMKYLSISCNHSPMSSFAVFPFSCISNWNEGGVKLGASSWNSLIRISSSFLTSAPHIIPIISAGSRCGEKWRSLQRVWWVFVCRVLFPCPSGKFLSSYGENHLNQKDFQKSG